MLLAAGASNAGPIGLVVVLLLGVATVLLIRNMDKRVKKLPSEFPEQPGRVPPTDVPQAHDVPQPPDVTAPQRRDPP